MSMDCFIGFYTYLCARKIHLGFGIFIINL